MKRLVLLVLVAGCGSDPVNTAGNYTVGVTNRDNGCMLANWTVGAMSSNIGVTITQSGTTATATITGATAIVLDLVLGSHAFTGTVDGEMLDLTLLGTRPQTTGNCTYTLDGEIVATSTGELITGRINYKAATNNHPDCTTMNIQGCVTFQDFNGSRPPQ
jgi:hypothetical protein